MFPSNSDSKSKNLSPGTQEVPYHVEEIFSIHLGFENTKIKFARKHTGLKPDDWIWFFNALFISRVIKYTY